MLLDIALGVLGAILFGRFQNVGITLPLIAAAALFMLLPDADFLAQIFRHRSFAAGNASHRHMLHNPLLYIPIGFAVLAPFNIAVAGFFAALSAMHFLHDSVGIGWGVRWLYPFSKRSYKFFSDHDGRLSWHFVTSWSVEEERELELRHNPGRDWFRRVYLRLHPIAIIEHVLTLIAVAVIAWLLV